MLQLGAVEGYSIQKEGRIVHQWFYKLDLVEVDRLILCWGRIVIEFPTELLTTYRPIFNLKGFWKDPRCRQGAFCNEHWACYADLVMMSHPYGYKLEHWLMEGGLCEFCCGHAGRVRDSLEVEFPVAWPCMILCHKSWYYPLIRLVAGANKGHW